MSSEELSELLDLLAETPLRIQSLLKDASAEQLRRRHAPGEFSCVENVCHLRDIEAEGYTTRINRILREDQPFLPDIDGGRLSVERDYNKQDLAEALRAFSLARTENLITLQRLDADQLRRAGTLEGVGTVTLESLLLAMREHDLVHVEDLQRITQSRAASIG